MINFNVSFLTACGDIYLALLEEVWYMPSQPSMPLVWGRKPEFSDKTLEAQGEHTNH